ncbi:hypothetical protein PENNAL_c0365G06936, partial [Penicillium nalgiovense]
MTRAEKEADRDKADIDPVPFSLPVLSGLVTVAEFVMVLIDEDGDNPRQLPSPVSRVPLAETAPAMALTVVFVARM